MRNHTIQLLSLVLIVSGFARNQSQLPDHPSKLRFSQLDWKVPLGEPHRVVLDNGLVTYIAADNNLPLVQIVGYVRYGTILDPRGKEGLGQLTAAVLKSGGTQRFEPDTLENLMERLAITVGIDAGETELVFRMSCLSEFTDTALTILEQILFHPAFDKDRITKERRLLEEEVKNRFTNPAPTLTAAYRKAMYAQGANSRLPTIQSLREITGNDIVALHKRIMRTENIVLSVSGDFDPIKMKPRLTRIFPSGSKKPDSLKNSINPNSPAKMVIVHRPITQAYVRFGVPLFTRPHPDFYAVSVLDLILGGGGFTSRLGTKIRSDEGLTYSIHSRAESNYIFPATFSITFHTKTENTPRAIALCLDEIERIKKEGVTDDELANAKKVLIDGLPSMFRSPADIVGTYAWNEYYGRPQDQYTVYPSKINAITKDDVLRVARTYLDTAAFTYVIVADTSRLFAVDTLKSFPVRGRVPLKITQPDSLPRLWLNVSGSRTEGGKKDRK